MKLEVWCIGKTSQQYIEAGLLIYKQKLKHYLQFELNELAESKTKRSADREKAMMLQAELVFKKLAPEDYLILLDEHGKKLNSRGFAQYLNKLMISSHKRVILLIGGAFGFHASLVQRSKDTISLSDMTFSHDMVRLFLLEQIYRGCTILKNEPYHND